MQKTGLVNLALLIFALAKLTRVEAKSPPYALNILPAKQVDEVLVRLVNKVSRRTVWTSTVRNYYAAHWSADHRVVAIETADRLLVWRGGYRLLKVAYPHRQRLGAAGADYDYIIDHLWSPDKQRLLIRFGASGSVDMNYGWLYCLKLGRRHYRYQAAPYNLIWKMTWQGNRTVLCWHFDYNKGKYLPTPRQWLVA
ncbi:MAG: hypothetical protein JO316_01360 [Abitibacteriaceae bacterium]|nr:hypothetical protein [Abditibacteriaceae bacterium]